MTQWNVESKFSIISLTLLRIYIHFLSPYSFPSVPPLHLSFLFLDDYLFPKSGKVSIRLFRVIE